MLIHTEVHIKKKEKIGHRPESLGFIVYIGVVYSHMICICSSKEECFKLTCCTTLCGRVAISIFKMLALITNKQYGQAFQCHSHKSKVRYNFMR